MSPTRASLATILLLLAACGGSEPKSSPGVTVPERPADAPPPAKVQPMRASGANALVLDRMPMQLDLSTSNRSSDEGARTRFVLTDLKNASKGRTKAPLPFRVPKGQRRFAPEGMTVRVNGDEATFASSLFSQRKGATWQFDGDDIMVRHKDEVTEIRVDYPGALDALRRLEWKDARNGGMSAESYVQYSVTYGMDSREGMLLPAPGTATWTGVTLPPAASFEAWLTLAPPPVASASDGATAVLEFVGPEGVVELGRMDVAAGYEGFTRWALDLSAHAGKQGDLRLRTLPGKTNVDDYVFIGSPFVAGTPTGDVRRVVVIGIDTLRPDHLGVYGYPKPTSPRLDAWSQDAVVFDRAWTSAPRTRPSFRAATTGRLPLDAVCAKNIGQVFDEAGFATAGIVANIHLNPAFGFDEGFDWWALEGEARVEDQIDRAITWLDQHEGRDTYLFLHLMDPHVFYVAPQRYVETFTKDLPPLSKAEEMPLKFQRHHVYQWMRKGELTENRRDHMVARYDAEIAYTDEHLGRLLDHLASLPGKSAVVIHSDHGEEFFEHDGYEHNHTLYQETTKAVLIIKPPSGTGTVGLRSDAMATLQDIAPTLYALAGLNETPPTDGENLLAALEGQAGDPDRAIPTAHLRYDAERWGVVYKGHKYVIFTGSGNEELYDLEADPGEHRNLASKTDTSPWWKALGESHHMDVGPGWRIEVELVPGTEVTIKLPADALSAGVIDPESVTSHPVNQVWGETPPVRPRDVAKVTLTDPRTITVLAGKKGNGILWVRFPEPVSAEGTELMLGDAKATVSGQSGKVGNATLTFKPGIVLDTPPGEVTRMAACGEGDGEQAEEEGGSDESGGEDDIDEMELRKLCQLGYINGPKCDRFLKELEEP